MKISGCIHDGWLQMSNFNSKLNKDYFYYILSYETTQEQFKIAAGGGTSVGNLNIEKVSHIQIPLPPLEIQQKIVAEIEVLEKKESEAREKIERLRGKIDNIIETKYTQEYKLDEIISLEYGIALPDQNRIKGDYPVVGSNGIAGWHNDFLVEAPAIIVGRKGSAGKVNWMDKNCTPIDTTFFVKPIDNVKYAMKILYYAIRKIDLEKLAAGTGVPGLNRNTAYAQNLNLPPLSEQQKIVSEIEKIETEIARSKKIMDEIPALKNEVLKKYL
jgi:type I restriction enzyme S subunit